MRKAFLTTDHANFLNRRRDTHNTHSALSLSLRLDFFSFGPIVSRWGLYADYDAGRDQKATTGWALQNI